MRMALSCGAISGRDSPTAILACRKPTLSPQSKREQSVFTAWKGIFPIICAMAFGVGLIALVMVHVYFAVRPEKFDITKSMIFGSMSREHYLEHHDPQRWAPENKG